MVDAPLLEARLQTDPESFHTRPIKGGESAGLLEQEVGLDAPMVPEIAFQ